MPAAGPLVLAGNHPNSLIDALALNQVCPRRVHFMARSGLFDHPILSRVLRSTGAIPVYRRQDNPADMSRNVESFSEAIGLLREGLVLGIFPEGVSHEDPGVRRLKTGIARIALEAEHAAGYSLGIRIVPIGLNFSDRAAFRSDLVIRVGAPISVPDYREAYLADPVEAVRTLVADVQGRIEGLVVSLHAVDLEGLVKDIERLFMDDLAGVPPARGETGARKRHAFKVRLAEAVDHFHRRDPEGVLALRDRIDRYAETLRELRLSDKVLRDSRGAGILPGGSLRVAALGLAGLPFAAWGILNNYLPYRLSDLIGRRYRAPGDTTVVSTARVVAGVLLFPVFHAAQTSIALWMAGVRTAAVYELSSAACGLFALFWLERLRRYRREIDFSRLWIRNRQTVVSLRARRRAIVRELLLWRDAWLGEGGAPTVPD